MKAKIGIAADHGGKELKHFIQNFLNHTDFEVVDYGVSLDIDNSVDYPDFAALLAADLAANKLDLGILVCGTGVGMAITANKFPGVRAAVVFDDYTARMARVHNDANVLCLGGRTLNHHRAVSIVKTWLEAEYEGGRHKERLNKIREIEKKNFKL